MVFKRDKSNNNKSTSRGFGFVGFKSNDDALDALRYFNKTYWGTSKLQIEIVSDDKSINDQLEDGKVLKQKRRRNQGVDESDNDDNDKSKKKIKTLKPVHLKAIEMAKLKSNQINDNGNDNDNDDEQSVEKDVNDVEMSDLEYMRSRMKRRFIPENDEDEEKKVADEQQPQQIQESVEEANERKQNEKYDQILQSSRLFLRNLPFSCTEDELKLQFSKFGVVNQVHIPLTSDTRTPYGVAYVSFASPNAALTAMKSTDGSIFQGRLLHILPAINKRQPEDLSKASVKKLRNKEKKENSENREFSWSGLYMNSDAVVNSIATRLKIDKNEILNSNSSSNPAVKVALAETHIINETKGFLKDQGVNMDAFSPDNKGPRLDGTLLVKNIPFGTNVQELEEMFKPFGELSRLLLPPAGTIAIVEFVLPQDARTAFKSLAYKRMGNSILYLEKAPNGLWATKNESKSEIAAGGPKPIEVDQNKNQTEKIDETNEEEVASTLFIKNISFSTTESKLISTFKPLKGFKYARIQTKPDPKRPNHRLSMGYGFVGFDEDTNAKTALSSMQNFNLDGHSLQVKFAQRGKESDKVDSVIGQSKTTKMIVKNVPFEASKKDIRELFGVHGQLKSVRLPRKFDKKTRGFAFLDFMTRRDAEIAYESLRHTHLLGRHLVLQWADDTTDIDSLREKTASSRSTNMPTYKSKFVGPDELAMDDASD